MNLDELKRRKKEAGFTNEDLAEVSGVPLGTVQRIMSGATKNPRRSTWEALEKALGGSAIYNSDKAGECVAVREPLPAYAAVLGKEQGEYTIDDYYSLPDDVRAELIDGVIYDMSPSPATHHQLVAADIAAQIQACIRSKKHKCYIMQDVDTQLDCGESTMVRPDVVLLCDKDKLKERCVFGAPDFVAEVLSPHTRKKDMTIKLQKYMNAGVKVYWMIDVKKRQVIMYDFTDEEFSPEIHGLEGEVRLSMPQGECDISFDHISEVLKDVFGI